MDPRHKFRAEILLKLRRRREGVVRRHFSRAAGDAETIARRIANLREALAVHVKALQEMMAASPDAMNLRLYRQCIADISQAITEQEGKLAQARRDLERRREQLLDAMRQRKTLESLKGHQAQHAAAAQMRADERRWDEQYISHKAATNEAEEDIRTERKDA